MTEMSRNLLAAKVRTLREAFAEVLPVVAQLRPADGALSRFYRRFKKFGSRDRRFISSMIFSYYRWRGWVGEATPDDLRACMYAHILDMDEIKPAVRFLAEEYGLPEQHLTPLGSADLVEKGRAVAQWQGRVELASWRELVPAWTRSVLPEAWDERTFRCWVETLQYRLPVWLRIDQGRQADALRYLAQHGLHVDAHEKLDGAFRVAKSIPAPFFYRPEAAVMEIQDLASQCVGFVCAPQPGQSWWDACAGAGGKSLHLMDLMNGRGRLLLTDVRAGILKELNRRIRRKPYRHVDIQQMDATQTSPNEQFDGVLADPSCSGLGTWARNPDARWRTAPESMHEKAQLQKRLLDRCCRAVKPGGVLVYSVCTLTQLETMDMVQCFLEQHDEFIADEFPHPLDGQHCAGKAWLLPWEKACIGMFIARFRKK